MRTKRRRCEQSKAKKNSGCKNNNKNLKLLWFYCHTSNSKKKSFGVSLSLFAPCLNFSSLLLSFQSLFHSFSYSIPSFTQCGTQMSGFLPFQNHHFLRNFSFYFSQLICVYFMSSDSHTDAEIEKLTQNREFFSLLNSDSFRN